MLQAVSLICSLGTLVCFIMVVVKMFQNGKTTAGIVTILTLFCCGIGNIVALVIGWQNADRWNIKQLMIAYTVLFLINIGLAAATFPAQYAEIQRQMELQQQQMQGGVPAPVAP